MAGVLRYASTGISYNGEDFRVEIWDKNWTGGGYGFKIGGSGPIISYDTNGDEKFSKIITSKFEFAFIVENSTDNAFIDQLRGTSYNERDVYVYVFNSSSINPIWSGYIILDLANEQDVSYPFEVKLKAVDGLGLLKDMDFVPDISILPPYAYNDTYIPLTFKKVTYWLKEILLKAGLQTTSDSPIYSDYRIKTSVNWFNEMHPTPTVLTDPLDLTSIHSLNWYKEKDNDSSLVTKYNVKNCYEVLEDICKAWGMRCVYWHGSVHFIQISEYANAETGSVANPVNITTRTYDKDGVFISAAENLGDYNALYDLKFENTNVLGLQKLSGTNYGFYPPIKEITTNHLSISNQNNFQSFPLLANGGGSTSTGTHHYETISLGIFTDSYNFDGFYSQIMLKFNNQTGFPQTMQTNWTIRARQVGAGSWQKMLDVNASGTLVWNAFVQPTSTSINPTLVFQSQIILSSGVTSMDLMSLEIGSGNIPIDNSFVGDWEFEYYTHTYTFEDTLIYITETYNGHGGIKFIYTGVDYYIPPTVGTFATFYGGGITYSNISGASNMNSSMFSPIFGGVIGSQSQNVSFTTTLNSYIIDLKDLPFGDNQIATPGAMIVFDGSLHHLTDFTGTWGVGVNTGNDTFTLLLCKEIMANQQSESYKLSGTSVLSITNKEISSGGSSAVKAINPIGRIKDKDDIPYVFLRGDFNLLTDECSGEWFEFDHATVTGTSTTTDNGGLNSGVVIGGSVPTYVPQSSSPITSLDITEMLTSTFKIGDVLELFDVNKQKRYNLSLTRDYTIGETTILFNSLTFDVDINVGSLIILNDLDFGEQYQRKSNGTIGGMPVTASTLGPLIDKSGNFTGVFDELIGVDLDYIKLVPRDFIVNGDGAANKAWCFDDTGTTGIQIKDANSELWAFAQIPDGKKATDVEVWGNNTKVVEVYELNVNVSGIGTSVGTGVVGTIFSITDVNSNSINYLGVRIITTGTSNRIYGGKITIVNI